MRSNPPTRSPRLHLFMGAAALVLTACSSGTGYVESGEDASVPDAGLPFTVVSSSPADGAVGVPGSAVVEVTFNRAPNPLTVKPSSFNLAPAVAGTFSFNEATVVFTPSAPLASQQQYTLTVSTEISDADGVPLAGAYTARFTTAADTTAPDAVTDLAKTALTPTSVSLKWTATGDDGKVGNAAGYELRYASGSACPLTSTSFAAATRVTTSAPKAPGSEETATVTGLTAKVDYCFAVRVLDEVPNTSALSNPVAVRTPDVIPPDAPVLTTGALTGTSIEVKWTAVGDDGQVGTAAKYDLRRATGAGCPLTQATFTTGTQVATTAPQAPGAQETVTVTGLTQETDYCFLLEVSDADDNKAYSNNLGVRTPDGVAPAAIADLAAALAPNDVTGKQVRVTWTATGDDGTNGTALTHELRFAPTTAGTCPLSATAFTGGTVATGLGAPKAAGQAEALTVTVPATDTSYCFLLKVSDDGGNAVFSNVATVRTPDITPPGGVTNLSAANTSGDTTGKSVTVNWTATGDDGGTGTATTQELRYLPFLNGACALTPGTFGGAALVAGLGAPKAAGTQETIAFSLPASDTSYCLMLKVVDDANNATLSNVVSVRTGDVTGPAAIANLAAARTAGDATGTSVTVTWTASGDDGATGTAASYELRYAAVPSGGICPLSPTAFTGGTAVTGLGAPLASGSAETAAVTALATDTAYCFLLKVLDDGGNAAFSNVATVTTPDVTAPGAIADLAAAPKTGDATGKVVTVTWTATGDDGATGTATAQELRYATVPSGGTCPLSATAFTGGTAVTLPAPGAAGAAQTVDVTVTASDAAYCFLLETSDEANNASFSNVATVTLPDVTAPAAVADLGATLTAGDTTGKSVTVAWTATGDDGATGTATAQELRYAVVPSGGACPLSAADFTGGTAVTGLAAPRAAGTAESVVVTVPASDTAYCFLLKDTDDAAHAAFSNVATVRTPDVTAPAAVADLAVAMTTGDTTGKSVTATWTATGDDGATGTATSQELRFAAMGTNSTCPLATDFASGTLVGTVGAPKASGLAETAGATVPASDTGYCFQLKVTDDAGNTALSNVATVRTPDVTAPAAVANLAAAHTGGDTTGKAVTVSWTATGDDGATGTATSQELRYAEAPGGVCPLSASSFTGTVVAGLAAPQVAGSAETTSVTVPKSDTAYCFLLKVTDDAGLSSFSNVANVTLPDVTAPATVTNLAATPASSSLALTWTASGDDGLTGTAAANTVYYAASTGACPTATAPGYTGYTAVTAPVTKAGGSATPEAFNLTGLSASTQYCVFVVVSDEVPNRSAASNVVTATTQSADPFPPAAITDLRAELLASASVRLSWTAPSDTLANSTTGPVTRYEVRYATDAACPLTAANFATGTQLAGAPTPGAPGTPESMTVSPTAGAAKTCFAVRSNDGYNDSPLSNVATPPGALMLSQGTITDTTATLSWTQVANDGTDAASGAATYDLRGRPGSKCPFTEANFLDADSFSVLSGAVTGAVGSTVSATATGLTPQQTYCFALRANDSDTVANRSWSISVPVSTPDTTPPAQVTGLAVAGTPAFTSFSVTFNASGDDGATGAATGYEVHYAALTDCSAFDAATATSMVAVPGGVAPPGTLTATLTGLTAGTQYCVGVIALDDATPANESTPSATLPVTTGSDTTPPAALVLQAVAVTSTNAAVRYTDVADDGTTAASGAVAAYTFKYVVVTATDCSALAASDFATATNVLTQPTPGAPGTVQTNTVAVQTADADKRWCLAAVATDPEGNTSAVSNWLWLRDNTAPAAVTNLAGTPTTSKTGATFTFTAPGDDGTTGTASAYVLKFKTGACPADPTTFDFAGATAMSGMPAPRAAGQAETITVAGLDYGTSYCFALKTNDEVPNASGMSNLATVTEPAATPGADITAVRTAILAATTIPVTLNLTIQKAIVSYTKPAFGGAAVGTADGPGFFLQNPDAADGPAVYVALDPTTFAGGVAPGDLVDVTVTAGDRQTCATACAVNAGLSVITAATGTKRGTGTVPAGQDANALAASGAVGVGWPLPAPTGNWALESELINVTVTIAPSAEVSPFVPAGTGFVKAPITTTGVPIQNANLRLRIPESFVASLGLQVGTKLNVKATPMWRTGSEVDVAAWKLGDLQVTTQPTCATSRGVVISQVYGGGGNSGATYKNDFIELHNRSSVPVPIGGWSVQYTSASNATWAAADIVAIPAGTVLPPGGYFLIAEAAGTGGTVSLPTPDATGTSAMGASSAKVALVSSTTALSGTCPAIGSAAGSGTVIDLVGAGSTSCSNSAPAPSNTNAVLRLMLGCYDGQSPSADFIATPPQPRNSASQATTCSCGNAGPRNGQGSAAGEVDFCNLQFPATLSAAPSATTVNVYGQLYQSGLTPTTTATNIAAEVGYGPAGSDAMTSWVFFPATQNTTCTTCGNNNEYQKALPAPSVAGSYRYTYRMSIDSGAHFTYCDLNGAGANSGLVYEPGTQLGTLTVQ